MEDFEETQQSTQAERGRLAGWTRLKPRPTGGFLLAFNRICMGSMCICITFYTIWHTPLHHGALMCERWIRVPSEKKRAMVVNL
jgi:hypothetical protein